MNNFSQKAIFFFGTLNLFFYLAKVSPVQAAYTYIGNITAYQQDGQTFTFTAGVAKVRISLCTEEMVRVRLAPDGIFPPEETDVVIKHDWPLVNHTFSDGGSDYQIATNKLVVRINKSPLIVSFYDQNLNLINKDDDTFRLAWDVSTGRVFNGKTMSGGEKFYGFGEKFHAPLNKRGLEVEEWVSSSMANSGPSYVVSPFFMSTGGYGIYFHNSGGVKFRLGTQSAERYSFESPIGELDYYFLYGGKGRESFKRLLELLTAVVGRPYLPPLSLFGLAGIKGGYGQVAFEELAKDLRQVYRYPADMIGLDDGWVECKQNFTYFYRAGWANTTFHDPRGMYQLMDSLNFKNFYWLVPLCNTNCNPQFTEGTNNNYFVKHLDGVTDYLISNWTGTGPYVDFTNPAATAWWKKQIKENTKDHAGNLVPPPEGVKTDDVENVREDMLFADGRTGKEMHNLLGFLHHQAAWEATQEVYGRGYAKSRSGSIGMHRYPLIWAGDQHPEFSELQAVIPAGISSGLSGFAYWTNDLGGGGWGDSYIAGDELFRRWTQFSMFTASPLINNWAGPNRFPWAYSDETQNIFRRYLELHYRLMPYIYSQAYQAYQKGWPLMRGMMLEFPDDPGTYDRDYDYLLGESFLVAPVYEAGGTSRRIYLPPGRWTDYWRETVYTGPMTIDFSAPSDVLPLLVRGGAIIPMLPDLPDKTSYTVAEVFPSETVVIDIYPEGNSSFTMYEDDGTTDDYQSGVYATTIFESLEGDPLTIKIGARQGSYPGMPSRRDYRLQVHHLPVAPTAVRRGTTSLTQFASLAALETASEGWYYEGEKKVIYVKPSASLTGAFQVSLLQGGPTPTPGLAGDLDGDGEVDKDDVLMILNNWGGSGGGDANNDGQVNGMDFGWVVRDWP